MIKNTTFKCPSDKGPEIKKTAGNRGMFVSEFINYSLNNNLPLNSIPHFKKYQNIKKIGVIIPENIKKRIEENQETLSTEIRKIKQWEIILHCVLLECENDSIKYIF